MVLIFAILARAYVYMLLFELGTSKDRSMGHMAESSSLGTESSGLAHVQTARKSSKDTRVCVCVCSVGLRAKHKLSHETPHRRDAKLYESKGTP